MPTKKCKLSREEIARPFEGPDGAPFPPILSPDRVAELLDLSPKTIYLWMAAGRLDGAFRKRGKHCLFWRDRVIDLIFNGKEWTNNE